ncbi:MAG: hypothetical protein COZ46_02995 [Verrucomicrobia bacterium CG_4_10_14_3_um_filter_43_23]|nr:MAG: hypothetical protein COZ46_02995 [Verrucomicrobia bacterium CG_4_10_14_3_um_filter_43_23]
MNSLKRSIIIILTFANCLTVATAAHRNEMQPILAEYTTLAEAFRTAKTDFSKIKDKRGSTQLVGFDLFYVPAPHTVKLIATIRGNVEQLTNFIDRLKQIDNADFSVLKEDNNKILENVMTMNQEYEMFLQVLQRPDPLSFLRQSL